MSSDPPPPPGPATGPWSKIGPYRVARELGRRGAATVYEATDAAGRAVEVQLLPARLAEDAAAAERFEAEARALAALHHPNLQRVLGAGREGGRPYLAAEAFAGRPLAAVLAERRLGLAEAIAVLRAIARGLGHAHGQGLVHRGLNSGNVLVSADLAAVKVAGFGLGRLDVLAGGTAVLATGEISLRTFHYLAPEQGEGGAADARSDLYSAGVIFHEMLTGRAPGPRFALPSQIDPEIPSEVDVVVLKCLARNPAERFGSAQELLAELDRLEEALRLRLRSQLQGISRSLGGEGKGRRSLLWVGLGVLVVAVAVVLFLVAR